MKSALLIGIACLMAGCSAVYSPVPFGEESVNIVAEVAQWEGTWITEDGDPMTVKVMDATNGIIRVDSLTRDKDGNLGAESLQVHIRSTGAQRYASYLNKDDDADQPHYLWGKIRKQERAALIWIPDACTG